MNRPSDELSALTALDPIDGEGLAADWARHPASAALLTALLRDAEVPAAVAPVQPRRSSPSSTPRWVRRSGAVAAALALLAAGRIALDTQEPALARVAVASDGSVRCSGSGYAAPIAPHDADLRLLPEALPAGWQLGQVAARWTTLDDPASCSVPALGLHRVDQDRRITATVDVLGPFSAVDLDGFLGERTTVDVDGQDAIRFDVDGLRRWIWTTGDRSWVMEASGLTADDAALLQDTVSTTNWTVNADPAAAARLDLVVDTRRDGAPPGRTPAHLDWYAELIGPDGQAATYFVRYSPDQADQAIAAAPVGSVLAADGRSATSEYQTEAGDRVVVRRGDVEIQIGAGPLFPYDDDPTPEPVPTSTLYALIDSLADAPQTDPRLVEHAYPEDTVPHP